MQTAIYRERKFVKSWNVAGVPFTSSDASAAPASVTDAPASGKKLRIEDIIINVAAAMTVTVKEQTSGTVVFGPITLAANATVAAHFGEVDGPLLPVADKTLQVQTSVLGTITVHAGYHSE